MLKKLFKAYQERKGRNLVTARIGIRGMTCKRCVRTVKKALLTKTGVRQVLVDLKTGVASVTYDANKTDVPALQQIITRKGYFPEAVAELVQGDCGVTHRRYKRRAGQRLIEIGAPAERD